MYFPIEAYPGARLTYSTKLSKIEKMLNNHSFNMVTEKLGLIHKLSEC